MSKLCLLTIALCVFSTPLYATEIVVTESAKDYVSLKKAEKIYARLIQDYEKHIHDLDNKDIKSAEKIIIVGLPSRYSPFQLRGKTSPIVYTDNGELKIHHLVTIEPASNSDERRLWIKILRHEFKHVIYMQLTEEQRSEIFAELEF